MFITVTNSCINYYLYLTIFIDFLTSNNMIADNADYEDDVPEALVSATCQTSTSGWEAKDLEHFLNQFLHDHLIELRQYLMYSKCGLEEKGMAHTAVPQNYPPVPLGDKILYAKKRSPKSPVLRVHDSGYGDMNLNDLYSSSHSNNYSTSSGNGTGTGSGSASGTGSGSSSGNGLSTVGTKEEQKLHLSVTHSLTRQHQHTQSLVPLTLQTTPYVHPPAHTQSHIHAHTYTHGTDSGHPSPAHSPGIQVPDPFAEHSHGEPSTPDVVPQHRGGARGLMRRLAPSRENSKGAGLGHALGAGGTGSGSGGITTVQPGEEDNAHMRTSTSHHPLPPATWRTSPGSFNLDAELTDQLMKSGVGHSQSSSGNVSPVPDHSVANKRKISLRKSLSSLSPFSHAHNPAPVPAPSSSSLTPPQSTTPAHKAHPHTVRSISMGNGIGLGNSIGTGAGTGTGTMSGSNSPKHHNQSEPSSPWGLSQPFPVSQNTHTPTQSLSSIQNMGGKRRNRSNNSNPEASVLRGQIAAKEYEVQRIAKDLERRREKDRKHESIANPSLGMISRVADPKPKTSETAAQLYHQSQELAKVTDRLCCT